ncbi:uncharacterized protein LOC110014992 [Oryzias latipes]|uniref:uncharacterized protein LOC110014992 n=1 Tax=Oryzias latipes TaxID=8090 RepID=UPI0009DA1F24|nr:uncharacterized protein LOC110014992 [Oryzias latipes]
MKSIQTLFLQHQATTLKPDVIKKQGLVRVDLIPRFYGNHSGQSGVSLLDRHVKVVYCFVEVYGILASWNQQVLPVWNARGEGPLSSVLIVSGVSFFSLFKHSLFFFFFTRFIILQVPGLQPSPKPWSPAPTGKSPEPQKSPSPSEMQQSAQVEDEEVFEEIRRLRLERGRLLQKIKALEQQQQSALSALEELSQLKQRLEEAESERDRLLEELKGGHVIGASDSEDMDEMFDFPEKLLSKRSRASLAEDDADPETVTELRRRIEELTSQNSELVLKVQASSPKTMHTMCCTVNSTHSSLELINVKASWVK